MEANGAAFARIDGWIVIERCEAGLDLHSRTSPGEDAGFGGIPKVMSSKDETQSKLRATSYK